jgi:predicted small metal-binding protein
MARKVLECRSLIPDSKCTLLFVGEADEVVKAFSDHAASEHGYSQTVDSPRRIEEGLQAAVFDGGDRGYIGEQFEVLKSGGVRVPGPGFVLRRFNGGDGGGIEMNCKCISAGGGSCDMTITGPFASCGGTCSRCDFETKIPGSLSDWLFEDV